MKQETNRNPEVWAKGKRSLIAAAAVLLCFAIGLAVTWGVLSRKDSAEWIDRKGNTVATRFKVPQGYTRVTPEAGSYGAFLQNFPLKQYGQAAYHYDGSRNRKAAMGGVFAMDITPRNLEQCADSCMRLYAEYLYKAGRYEEISFTFASGMECDFTRWAEGWRPEPDGQNALAWVHTEEPDRSYATFRAYMDTVQMYANTASLQKQLRAVEPEQLQIGDIFVATAKDQGTELGHAVTVVDLCENKETGRRLVLVAESTTPASQTYVCRNRDGAYGGYWIALEEDGTLQTENWRCEGRFIRSFRTED